MQSNRPAPLQAHPLIYQFRSILDRLDLAELFPQQQDTEVELGSGDGTFLINYAQQHPERNFIGVERLLGRVKKIDRKGCRAGLRNVRGVRLESSYFLEYLLPHASISALHIYFPDPWPKRKHWRHRLINERFPGSARKALKPGGAVYLRTDDPDYFHQMLSVFNADCGFQQIETPVKLSELLTDFEKEFRARSVETLRLAYQAC